MGYNFLTASKEYCYYRYISSQKVVAVFDALQIDLLRVGLFNDDCLNLSKQDQIKYYKLFKEKLYYFINLLNNEYMSHIYEKLYLENNNIKNISSNIFEQDKIEYNKKLILCVASKIPDIYIKKKH